MTNKQEASGAPKAGLLLVDTRTDRIGVVMGTEGPYVQLRPPAGGIEWDVPPDDLRPADAKDQLRAKVAIINARARRRSLR
ncbi:hypothetical protein OG592_07980 [Streptomyces avidinii]|nr:hypothetical protein OG592_07980 [Streptomyces avidinii]